jgi:hypothetical protein
MIIDEDAIKSLIPDAEWHYRAGILTVFTQNIITPTAEEIAAEKTRLEQVKTQQEAEAAAKRQALLDKLGITEEEAKLLLS